MHRLPFGKHRDQPLAVVLAADPSYCRWLDGQPWFAEQFPVLRQALQMMVAGDYAGAARLPPDPPRRRRSRQNPPSATDIATSIALFAPPEVLDGGCQVFRPLAFARG